MTQNLVSTINIDWKPDKTSKISLSRQIVRYFIQKISQGDWIVAQKFPSQRKLSEIFEVNRSTIIESLDVLSSLGIIESNFGQGTIIINTTWSLLISNSPPNWQNFIDSGVFKANSPTIQSINKLEYVSGMIRLGTGEMSPDLIPHKMMQKVLHKVTERSLNMNYLEPLGYIELRVALCKLIAKRGIHVSPSCILIVSGALQALQLISLCMLRPHSTVFVETPSYISSLRLFQSAGMNLCGIPMDDDGIIPWMINKKGSPNETSLLYTMPDFQNPTGILMSEDRRKELMYYCRTNNLPIIEDDVFGDLWIDKPTPFPIKAYDENGIVMYLGSMSKSLAPGLRLGWVVGPESVIQRLGDVKMQTDYGSSSISQWALTEWLESGFYEEHLKVFRSKLKERRDLALRILNEHYHDIASWSTPSGGYYIWLRLNKNISTDKLFELALNEKLLINPGSLYDSIKNQCLRISYSYANPQDLSTGLIRLAQLIRGLND